MKFPKYFGQVISAPPKLQLIGLRGSRGSAKSESAARYALAYSVCNPNDTVLCCREYMASIKDSVKSLLDRLIEEYNLEPEFNSLDTEIKNKRGKGKIIFGGLANHTTKSLKSLDNVKLTLVEEAQTVSDNSIIILLPTVLRAPGSKVIFLWNTDVEETPVDALFVRDFVDDGTMLFIHSTYLDNPFFPAGLEVERKRFLKTRPKEYDNVWLGGYKAKFDALIYSNWYSDEFESPVDGTYVIGLDFGYTDTFAAIRCFVQGTRLYLDYEVTLKNAGVDIYPTLLGQIPDAKHIQIIADNSRPESIKYIREHGYPKIFGSLKGAGSKEEGIQFIKSYSEIIIHPRCVAAVASFAKYSYDVDKKTGLVKMTINHAFSDMPDAVLYGNEVLRRGMGAYANQLKPVLPQPVKWN